ncbi:probable peptide chain release factor C12orf65, mitochondrial [Centruroides sculpturatus]|uniref:probable peptide chain release factor C12orf65, mitochondrial n=1 Tax=Centruroides sculpturatus TaxID=218467 RepID=UPI000C6D44F5|nr:probable peptide chain release factor C12orf65, mitochondrial [Centruroides sculpturatus]
MFLYKFILRQVPFKHHSSVFSQTFLRQNYFTQQFLRYKYIVDRSKVPEINEDDLEEQFIRGSGPGGQAVNMSSNCVLLKHIPTGIVVKCHKSRQLPENRIIARNLLQEKLDNLYNGDMSVAAQMKRIDDEKSYKRKKKADKLREMKRIFKERNKLDEQ